MDVATLMNALETAWGVIANASDWDHSAKSEKAASEWIAAAERWRDSYHVFLNQYLKEGGVSGVVEEVLVDPDLPADTLEALEDDAASARQDDRREREGHTDG